MTQIEYLDELIPGSAAPATVAIGIFDGVHRGHQDILRRTAEAAHEVGGTPVALTFDIHPEDILAPERAPGYVATLGQRVSYIQRYGGGIERTVAIRFTREFASLAPEEFVLRYLVGVLGACQVFVGQDFRYGRARAGNNETLAKQGADAGFGVTVVAPVTLNGIRISSTQVRRLIREGDMEHARELLGHPFALVGRVAHGKRLGRTLGFPTANVMPDQSGQVLPGAGVYAGSVLLEDGSAWPAAVSVGMNPTTDSDGVLKVEAFLMDGFDGDLYGQAVTVSFGRKIRDQIRFESLAALIEQMNADTAMILDGRSPEPRV